MTTAELDQLLELLRKRGVIGFEGLGIKVTLDLTATSTDLFDPSNLVGDPDEDDEVEVLFHSSGIEPKRK